jgi:hypothetical protein
MTENRRAKLTTYVLASTSIATFAISWRFWTPYRTYPTVPYISGLHPTGFSVVVLVVACAGLVLACLPRKEIVGLSMFLLSTGFLILEDQSRLQPYIYVEFILALGLLYYSAKGGELGALRLAVAFVYLWTGLHKLNVHYFDEVFPWVFFGSRITHSLSFLQNHPTLVRLMAVSSAFLEVGASVLLAWPKTRVFGVVTVATIHAFALLLIGPIGMRFVPVVWPWNFAMVAYAIFLFWGYDGPILQVRDPVQALTIVLFGLLPILNLFSLCDAYLSFHAFSGATMDAYIQVPEGKENELPPAARRVLNEHRVHFFNWSLSDTRASAYPAERVYRSIFNQTCKSAPDLELVILSKPEWPSGRRTKQMEKCAK